MTPSEIRQIRGDRTRAAFADELGVNAHTIYRWELPDDSPHARRPRGTTLAKLAKLAQTAPPAQAATSLPIMAALQHVLDGHWRAAEGAFLRALRDDHEPARGRALASTGLALIELLFRADGRRAMAALGPALAPDAPASALVEATAALAYSFPDAELFDLGRVRGHAARVEGLASATDGPVARALAAIAEANAAVLAGNDELLARALARVEAMPIAALPDVPALHVDALRALAATVSGQARLSVERLDRLLADPRIGRCPPLEARCYAMRALRILEDLGDLDAALELARRARAIAADARLAPGVHTALALRAEAEALIRAGRVAEVPPVFAEADRILAEHGFPVTVVLPTQARFLLLTGQAGELDALAARVAAVDLPSLRTPCDGYSAWLTASAHLLRGADPDATMRAFRQAEQLSRGWGFIERDLLIAHASAALVDGTPPEARAILERAQRAADRRPAAWVTASLRRTEGALLVEEGRVDEGRAMCEAASATFAAAGDRLDAAIARYASAGMARILGAPDGDARARASDAELAGLGLPHPVWIDRALAKTEQQRAAAGAHLSPLSPPASSYSAALEQGLARLAVSGATTAMVLRELAAVAGGLAGAPVEVVNEEVGERAAGRVWFEIDGGAGHRVRLGAPAPLDAETRSALRVIALVAGLALQVAALRGVGARVPVTTEAIAELPGVVAASPPMRRLLGEVERLAGSRATVVITGESGAGKEVIASALHRLSTRAARPYVAFNCAAVPHDLFEGQLFGYRKGAFTGATADHLGVLRAADNGTVFLDEIGELPLDIQPKLLRFLDSGEVFPLGAQRPVSVDVRIIAATNRDLAAEVARGRFREDLFYRVHVVPLAVPPLRERKDDIVPLARHIAREQAGANQAPAFAPDALAALVAYRWPGNVRELRNVIARAMAYAPVPEVLTRALLGL